VTLQQQLEDAFHKLPIRRCGALPETLIPGIVRELVQMRRTMRVPELERHEEAAGSDTTKRELNTLKRRAEALLEAIDALHKPALDALHGRTSPDIPGFRRGMLIGPAGLTTRLRILISIAESARANVPDQEPNVGAGEKVQPARIADRTATYYCVLTGEEPTVRVNADTYHSYGPFLDLIKEVFGILGVDASPVSQATAAYRRFKAKSRPKKLT